MLFRPQSTVGWQYFFALCILMSSLLGMMKPVLRTVQKLHNHFWGSCESQAELFCCFSFTFLELNSLLNTKYIIIKIITITSMVILLITTIKGHFKRWRKRWSRWSHAVRTGCFTLPTQFALQYQQCM